mmetsp:Transcript_5406/g.10894  ORF Transcript_5406/g.10894 Transcript_5406/m.10894 type:complete len:206 (-) Transcript_5406:69-686(-)
MQLEVLLGKIYKALALHDLLPLLHKLLIRQDPTLFDSFQSSLGLKPAMAKDCVHGHTSSVHSCRTVDQDSLSSIKHIAHLHQSAELLAVLLRFQPASGQGDMDPTHLMVLAPFPDRSLIRLSLIQQGHNLCGPRVPNHSRKALLARRTCGSELAVQHWNPVASRPPFFFRFHLFVQSFAVVTTTADGHSSSCLINQGLCSPKSVT